MIDNFELSKFREITALATSTCLGLAAG